MYNGKTADEWFDEGKALYFDDKYEEAIECYDRALSIDPNNADAWYWKGSTLRDMGKHSEAIECYDKALEIDPNYILAECGKEESEEKLKPKLNGKTADEWFDEALFENDPYEKIKCYDNCLKLDPNNAVAWNNKGNSL